MTTSTTDMAARLQQYKWLPFEVEKIKKNKWDWPQVLSIQYGIITA
jgi:hypothetical protein